MYRGLGAAAIVAAIFAASSASAQGAGSVLRIYVGIDYQFVSPTYVKPFSNALIDLSHGGAVHAGLRADWLSVELGYMRSNGGASQAIANGHIASSARVSAITLDTIGYLPIIRNGEFNVYALGTFGIADSDGSGIFRHTTTVAPPTVTTTRSAATNWDWRAGAGFEYRLTSNFGVRVLARYQPANLGFAKNSRVYSAGINYYF